MLGFHRNDFGSFEKDAWWRLLGGAALAGGVLAAGLYLGACLRRRRRKTRLPDFFKTSKPGKRDEGYAVGI
jgi:hypothetical protein